MLSFGENGWIQYGWSEKLNRYKNYQDNFYIRFLPTLTPLSKEPPLDIAIKYIEKISQTYPPPYNLMCSGGTDSQAMSYAWLNSGIPFNIISVKYVSNGTWWNQHDLSTLEKFAEINNLNIDFKEFDVIHFLENELDYISTTYECPSPQISTHIKMTDLVSSGTIIFSGNFIQKGRVVGLSPALVGLHKFSLYKNRTDIFIIPFFFLENQELAYAFDRGSNDNKDNEYIKNGFQVIQQPYKITGFEEVKNFYDKYHERIRPFDRLRFSNKPSARVFDLLFRYPYEGCVNYQTIQLTGKK